MVKAKGGEKVVIDTRIAGVPQPTAAWTYKDSPLETAGDIFVETNTVTSKVTLVDVKRSQEGNYKLKIENCVGSAEAEFNLVVKGNALQNCPLVRLFQKWFLH